MHRYEWGPLSASCGMWVIKKTIHLLIHFVILLLETVYFFVGHPVLPLLDIEKGYMMTFLCVSFLASADCIGRVLRD